MHFALSWDITAENNRWKEINDQMHAVVAAYSWVKPLTTFYIVKVASQAEWDKILNTLGTIAKENKEKIHFVMTPLMNGGRYNGILPEKWWETINQRTDP